MVGERARRVVGPLLAVLLSVALAAGGLALAHDRGWLDRALCEGDCPVDGPIDDLDVVAQEVDGLPETSLPLSAEAVEAAVSELLDDDRLGEVSLTIDDLATGERLLAHGDQAMIPASSQKMLTSFATLRVLGPEERFATRVRLAGDTLTLVGGGDPLLADEHDPESDRASLEELAEVTAEALAGDGPESVTLAYDDSYFSSPPWHPAWPERYGDRGDAARMTALRLPPPRPDLADPAAAAARVFAGHLEDAGVEVRGEPTARPSDPDASFLVEVRGGTTGEAVVRSVLASDNYVTEVLGHHLALTQGLDPDYEGAAQAVSDIVTEALGEQDGLHIADASGLARQNRVTTATLTSVMSQAARDPDQAPLFAALPIAAYTGTLGSRFTAEDTEAGAGLVRAKTGTLNGVRSLTGMLTTADGGAVVFSLMANEIPEGAEGQAAEAMDAILAALAACPCT